MFASGVVKVLRLPAALYLKLALDKSETFLSADVSLSRPMRLALASQLFITSA